VTVLNSLGVLEFHVRLSARVLLRGLRVLSLRTQPLLS
jgi:hypothetical protein